MRGCGPAKAKSKPKHITYCYAKALRGVQIVMLPLGNVKAENSTLQCRCNQ